MKKIFTHDTRGRTAVVTGASSGIGESFAKRFAGEGYNLLLIARRKERLDELARDLERRYGVAVAVCDADLSSAEGVRKAERRMSEDASIEILVNSAGFGTRGFFAEVAPEKINGMVFLHTVATTRLTRAVLPLMIEKRRGYVVNVSSLGAFFTTSHYVTYSATKAFINMFTIGLRDELEGTGVKIQALCPGLTTTGFMHTDEFRDFNYAVIPEFAWMSPDEVVDESLAALEKNRIIVIPGRGNRIFIGTLKAPIIGPFFGMLLGMLGRGRNAY